jgi:hypothetical protein
MACALQVFSIEGGRNSSRSARYFQIGTLGPPRISAAPDDIPGKARVPSPFAQARPVRDDAAEEFDARTRWPNWRSALIEKTQFPE